MTKQVLKISIIVLWVGLMGWWWLESRTWPAPKKIDVAFLPDYYNDFNLFYGKQKIGWAHKSLSRQQNGSYKATQGVVVKVKVAEHEMQITADVLASFDQALNLVDFRYIIKAPPFNMLETGVVKNGYLTVDVGLGEHEETLLALLNEHKELLAGYADLLDITHAVVSEAPSGPLLTQFIPTYLGHLGIKVGQNYSLTVLNTLTRHPETIAVRVEEKSTEHNYQTGRKDPVFRVRLGTGEQSMLVWVDSFGRTVRENTSILSMTRANNSAEAMAEASPLIPPAALTKLFKLGGETLDLIKTPNKAATPVLSDTIPKAESSPKNDKNN